jgi:hypothetical protein
VRGERNEKTKHDNNDDSCGYRDHLDIRGREYGGGCHRDHQTNRRLQPAQGQATSAHVVNTGEERGIVIDWRVLDSAGNVLARSERRRVELGQTSSFDFGPLALREGERAAIRLELIVEGASRNKPAFIAT